MSEPYPEARSEDGHLGLWEFALDFYRREGVADACLELQDVAGVDVNILIYALWRVLARQEDVDPSDIERADALVSDWRRDVVLPLRALRRGLKIGPSPAPSPSSEKLRGRIKAAELDAEHIELDTLERSLPSRPRDGREFDLAQRAEVAIWRVIDHYKVAGAAVLSDAVAALIQAVPAETEATG